MLIASPGANSLELVWYEMFTSVCVKAGNEFGVAVIVTPAALIWVDVRNEKAGNVITAASIMSIAFCVFFNQISKLCLLSFLFYLEIGRSARATLV
jgi:hypothetical protein